MDISVPEVEECTTTIALSDSTSGIFDIASSVFTANATTADTAQIRLATFTATDCGGRRSVATVPLRTGSQPATRNRISAVQRVVFETTPDVLIPPPPAFLECSFLVYFGVAFFSNSPTRSRDFFKSSVAS